MIIACQVLLYKKDEYQILASEAGRESTVMLSEAKHLSAHRDRPEARAQGDNRNPVGADYADEQIHPAMT
jgi:hypothetical protein